MTADMALAELTPLADDGWEVALSVGSTQQEVLSGRSLKLVAASQTTSYGREGRIWSSPPGGLWMSWKDQLPKIEGLTLALALAVARMARHLGVGCWLRWPNDVMVGQRKLAGCLVDARLVNSQWQVVVGLGLNLKTDFTQASPDIAQTATSLQRETGIEFDLAAAARQLIDCWTAVRQSLMLGGFGAIAEECQSLMFAGRAARLAIRLEAQTFESLFSGLGSDGALLLSDGQRLYGCQHLSVLDDTTDWGKLS
jgi:BirA family transcriptional regulator, biotin operon repressor / biotin---[acetyl-CoA-carboxylase] ligase